VPVVLTSTSTTVPSLGSMRRFWSASLITRSRSAAGLKSTPKAVPFSGTANVVVPTGVAAPVAVSIVYSRLELPTP
jgi:hypothetical protein